MESTVQIPLVGGSGDGDVVLVELDATGRPPLTHHHLNGGGLAQADMYELESVDEPEAPWRYAWRGRAT